MPANAYISNLMRWINTLIDDETTFPVEKDARFDENFITEVASVVFKRLLRVYSHLYHHHFSAVCDAGLKSVLNTSFHHFVLFVTRFRLVSSREFAPVRDIVKAIM
ncbi:MOB kinase activator-like 1B [Zancudomyces culisetae]|nr:MOB kinase activator-like 1B [Zancudomyces culisetae]|eukprot:OMH79497.1 MOB kinase activator-like 1B [Zancudomyces culisetae]